ncbi:cation acetate symporter [Paenibacillus sp. N1-5-1-14]|uniref:solute symporter family protein n=1 Tax=Paenibacillus radicibacter TaxID=2972488 RepID=UPI002158F946|nr:cation acetate symporter [Paenibacillus radicibacter]MCR8641222.1 cation acetate symporter [Paenibacillus radicibacter]
MNITAFVFFLAVVIGTLVITYHSAKRTMNTHDFYVAGNRLTGLQNGLAISGDYMSAASFLGVTGLIAIYGFDGFFYSIGFLASYVIVLYWIAEPLHNLGRYTMADAVAVRFDAKSLRGWIAMNNILITIFYMIAQLVGAGGIIHLLLDMNYSTAILVVGVLMTIYVGFGGMLATSWVQIIKAIILVCSTFMVSLMVLSRFDWNVIDLFNHVSKITTSENGFLHPGNFFSGPLDTLSFNLSLVLGTAGLPHIISRFYTVKDTQVVRSSIVIATWVMGAFYIMTIFLGFGAAAFVERSLLIGEDNMAATLLAKELGGEFWMAFIAAVAFATILAVVSGLVLAASSAFSHDIYSIFLKKGQLTEGEQMSVAKYSAVIVGFLSIVLALGASKLNVAFLVSFAFAIAASANLPVLLLTMYWRKFTTAGAIIGLLTGLISSILFVILSPNVMNPVNGWIQHEALFPLKNPGVVSIPLGFLGGIVGSLLTARSSSRGYYSKMIVQSQLATANDDHILEK